MPQDVTTGEIYRRLEDMDERANKRFERLESKQDAMSADVATLKERTSRPGMTGAAAGSATGLLALLGWEWLKAKLGGS